MIVIEFIIKFIIIKKYQVFSNGKYLDLLKTESEINENIKDKIKKMMENDDNKLNDIIKKFDYIEVMKDSNNFDLNNILKNYDKQQELSEKQKGIFLEFFKKTSNISDNQKNINDKNMINKIVNNLIHWNQINVYGVKISNLILNIVFIEKFRLHILNKEDFYDSDTELTELYDKLNSKLNKNNQNKIISSTKKINMPRTQKLPILLASQETNKIRSRKSSPLIQSIDNSNEQNDTISKPFIIKKMSDIPKPSEFPEILEIPKISEFPEILEIPKTSEFSEIPKTSEFSEIPKTSEFSEIPKTSEFPEIPEIENIQDTSIKTISMMTKIYDIFKKVKTNKIENNV